VVSSIKTALKSVGIRSVPISQLVWQFLNDSGPHNANGIAAALKMPVNNVSSLCGQLRDRKMVTFKIEEDKTTGHKVAYFSVVGKGKKYKLLPVSAEARARVAKYREKMLAATEPKSPFTVVGTAHLPAVPPVESVVVAPVVVTPVVPADLLDRISVREAYALYLELKRMFTQDNPFVLAATAAQMGTRG
jgi:hypothetical protein